MKSKNTLQDTHLDVKMYDVYGANAIKYRVYKKKDSLYSLNGHHFNGEETINRLPVFYKYFVFY